MNARSMMRRLRRGIGQAGYGGADRAAITFRIPLTMREFSKTAARFHDHFRTRGVVVRVMPGRSHG